MLGVGARRGDRLLIELAQSRAKVVQGGEQFGQSGGIVGAQRNIAAHVGSHCPRTARLGRIKRLLHKLRPRRIVHNPLILVNIALHNRLAQSSAIHRRVLGEFPQESGVGPAQGRLYLLGSDHVASVGSNSGKNLDLAHQTGVKADQIEGLNAGIGADRPEGRVDLVK